MLSYPQEFKTESENKFMFWEGNLIFQSESDAAISPVISHPHGISESHDAVYLWHRVTDIAKSTHNAS